jgi:hypothetical protein
VLWFAAAWTGVKRPLDELDEFWFPQPDITAITIALLAITTPTRIPAFRL